MNIALILAGGSGKRTEQDIPKQFFSVDEKPIIIYTLETFQKHPDIDGILVVCLEGWDEILKAYARSYGITKLNWVIAGGENGQESTQKGIYFLENVCKENDIIIIHDAIRPMVTPEIISDCIVTCKKKGNGLAAIRCQETIVRTGDGVSGDESIDRSEVMRVQTPQAYRYDKLLSTYKKAQQMGIQNEIYANTLMIRMGEKVFFSIGSSKNIKITTIEDLDIFRALNSVRRENWLK